MATFATWIQPGTWSSSAALSEASAMDSAGKVGNEPWSLLEKWVRTRVSAGKVR